MGVNKAAYQKRNEFYQDPQQNPPKIFSFSGWLTNRAFNSIMHSILFHTENTQEVKLVVKL